MYSCITVLQYSSALFIPYGEAKVCPSLFLYLVSVQILLPALTQYTNLSLSLEPYPEMTASTCSNGNYGGSYSVSISVPAFCSNHITNPNKKASRLWAGQQYVYVLCIWQLYLFFLISDNLCILCLAEIFIYANNFWNCTHMCVYTKY